MGALIQYCTEASRFDGEFAWQAAGMGYVIVTERRHLIVVDGGGCREDAEGMIKIMEQAVGGRPHVDMWIITHPHNDHYTALMLLAQTDELRARVDVEAVCCCIPGQFTWMRRGELCDGQKDLDRVGAIASQLGCREVRPTSGDRFDIDGTVVEFLYTYEDAEVLADPNELSMVFTVTGKHRKVMFTGDSYPAGLEVVYRRWAERPEVLKSDILQVAHHGLNGGHTLFYRAVDADVALVPISRAGDRAMSLPEENRAHHNLYAQRRAATVIKAFCGTSGVEI